MLIQLSQSAIMMKKVIILVFLLVPWGTDVESQFNSIGHKEMRLTKLSENLLDIFINDSINIQRLDPEQNSLILFFMIGDSSEYELCIYDSNLLSSCLDNGITYISEHSGFSIFYRGKENTRYLCKGSINSCARCDSLTKNYSGREDDLLENYDGSTFYFPIGATLKNIKTNRESIDDVDSLNLVEDKE